MCETDTESRVQSSITFKGSIVRARTNLNERKNKKMLSEQFWLIKSSTVLQNS